MTGIPGQLMVKPGVPEGTGAVRVIGDAPAAALPACFGEEDESEDDGDGLRPGDEDNAASDSACSADFTELRTDPVSLEPALKDLWAPPSEV
jgi:hypothetical protein